MVITTDNEARRNHECTCSAGDEIHGESNVKMKSLPLSCKLRKKKIVISNKCYHLPLLAIHENDRFLRYRERISINMRPSTATHNARLDEKSPLPKISSKYDLMYYYCEEYRDEASNDMQ